MATASVFDNLLLLPSSVFRHLLRALVLSLLLMPACPATLSHEESAATLSESVPVTVSDPSIPLDELDILLKPLTVDELKVEAEAWMDLLREKTLQTSQAELAVKQKNKSIETAEEVQEVIEKAQDALEDVKQASLEAGASGDLDSAQETQELAREAREAVAQTVDSIESAIETQQEVAEDSDVSQALTVAEETRAQLIEEQAGEALDASEEASLAADQAVAAAAAGDTDDATRLTLETALAAQEATQALEGTATVIDEAIAQAEPVEAIADSANLEETARLAEAVAESEMKDKENILQSVNELRTQRTALGDRLNLVLDELSAKMGLTPEGLENEFIVPFRLYISAVNSVKVDVSDTQSALSNVLGWLRSDLGGVRLAKNLGYFLLAVLSFWFLGWILGRLVDRALKITRITAELMRSVIVRLVRRGVVLVGIIVGLSAMDINIGPILALLGAAGFVVAFALQDTLSNFASGIMMMIYRPFDVGDLISVEGVTGEARSMNLVSTTIATRDNQLLVVPNNTIWHNIITNITGSATRRVDLIFRIRYHDDVETALALIEESLKQNPLVLDDPEPVVAVDTLGAVSVDLICRPWARTDDYWDVYRGVTRDVKERFQAAGLEPPYLGSGLPLVPPLPGGGAAGSSLPIS